MRSSDLDLMLKFLLEAAAPLPAGSGSDPAPGAPRELLVSYHQVAGRLAQLGTLVCGAQSCAVISSSGPLRQVDAAVGIEIGPLRDALKETQQCEGQSAVEHAWQTCSGPHTETHVVDQYGDTSVFLSLSWTAPPTEEQIESTTTLARVGFGALRFQRKAAASRRRARWVIASRQLTDSLLSGADEEEALQMVAAAALSGAGADAALIFLPSIGNQWTCEIASGENSQALVGLPFPDTEFFEPVRNGKHGLIQGPSPEFALGDSILLSTYGPMVVAPIYAHNSADGAIALLRSRNREPFAPDDLPLTEAFASQTSLALEVASARHSRSLAVMLEERARISRDLHDFAVQQLFATGMKLDLLRQAAEAGAYSARSMTEGLTDAMGNLEEAVRQIRSIVHDLKESDIELPFGERMEREASRARQVLGFAPSLIFDVDAAIIDSADINADVRSEEMSARVDRAIADDAIAIVREALSNIARHARAHAARIDISVSGHGKTGELTITVTDDGQGIDPTETRASGLANMSTRAKLHGGSFGVGPGPMGRGTSLTWRVPLEKP